MRTMPDDSDCMITAPSTRTGDRADAARERRAADDGGRDDLQLRTGARAPTSPR